ncbi:MAG: LysR family transcriptional regulator [Pseudomarimonas sp.]
MDRIECMRTFVEAVRAGGFSAAARKLDLPRSKVSKQIQSLEAMLGVQLLMRTTRNIHLTDAGTAYLDAAVEILHALDAAEDQARGSTTGLRGVLRVNAPVSFGVRVLSKLVPKFHALHPDVELQLSLTDQLIDPVKGGFDLTIRIANLQDSSLAARQIMPAPRRLVASPTYLKHAGTPASPKDLTDASMLNYGCLQGGTTLAFTRGKAIERVRTRGPLMADNGDFLCLMAEAGMGIALLPDFITAEAIAAKRLVPVLNDWLPPPIAVHALFPAARNLPRRTRLFVDFLLDALKSKR